MSAVPRNMMNELHESEPANGLCFLGIKIALWMFKRIGTFTSWWLNLWRQSPRTSLVTSWTPILVGGHWCTRISGLPCRNDITRKAASSVLTVRIWQEQTCAVALVSSENKTRWNEAIRSRVVSIWRCVNSEQMFISCPSLLHSGIRGIHGFCCRHLREGKRWPINLLRFHSTTRKCK